MRIMLVGPDMSVKGGISTVIQGIILSELSDRHVFLHLATHRDDLTKVGKFVFGIKAYARFLNKVYTFRPDIIHIHSSFGASFYRKSVIILMSRMLRIKQINHIHGAAFDAFYSNAGAFKKKIVKAVYNIPDTTVVLSNDGVEKICAICKRTSVICLNNFAILPSEDKATALENYTVRENIVLFLGEVGKRKGAYDIPEIVEEVAKHIKNVRFIIAGNGDLDQVSQLVKERGLSRFVVFIGWIGPKEKAEWLLKARIFLLPSYNEGLPMSILEAMSYGLPVISTTVGGIPELVQNDENGYLYQPGDIAGMSEGVLKLLKNEAQALTINHNNRLKIKDNYSLDAFAFKLDRIYAKTIGKKGEL